MSEDAQLLLAAAELAREQAYAPYSHLFVGAAVMGSKGKMYAGCNVENASYGLSICAERAAIFAAITAGERRIQGLAVVSSAGEPSMPCGACRQVIQEFAASPEMPVALAGAKGAMVELTLAELFPYPFALP
ncbi:MAG TPA: cytidine deaminase [Chloroflexota bacterium]|nr:cytidine deaminase [Chloroflexota bacterium]